MWSILKIMCHFLESIMIRGSIDLCSVFVCHQVMHLSDFMTSLAQEAVVKICQLFHNSSSLLQLAVSHFYLWHVVLSLTDIKDLSKPLFLIKRVVTLSVTQCAAEDPSKRLEVTETELKLMLEVDAGQTDKERPMEGNCQLEEDRDSEGETLQRQRSGRKNCRGDQFITFVLFLLKCCWNRIWIINIQSRSTFGIGSDYFSRDKSTVLSTGFVLFLQRLLLIKSNTNCDKILL